MQVRKLRSKEILQKAIAEVGYNPKIIKEKYFWDSHPAMVEKELSKVRPNARSGIWSIEETATILEQFKEKGLELRARSLLPKLNRSYDSILSRSFKVSLWIKATQLQLEREGQDASVHAAVDLLLGKIRESGECNVELRRNPVYLDLLHQGIKKFGLYPEKIISEFLPSFCVSGIMMDLSSYSVPDKKLQDAILNLEIARHVQKNGFFKWEELAQRLSVSLERLVRQWEKMRDIYDQDPHHFERDLEKIQQSQQTRWDTKCENTLQLGKQLFGDDMEQIQQKLLPQFDLEYLRVKMMLLDSLFVSKVQEYGENVEPFLETMAKKCEVSFKLLKSECKSIKKVSAIDVHELDKHIKGMLMEKKPSLTAISKKLGVDYRDVVVRWNKLRKMEGIPTLKKRGDDDLRRILEPDELKKIDALIIDYATSPDKSLSELPKVVGKKPGSIYRRWNELRKQGGLQSVRKIKQ
jgi:predicted transcriptional regulator